MILAAPGAASGVNDFITGTTNTDVLVFGTLEALTSTQTKSMVEGATKTMRKLNKGDKLILAVRASSAVAIMTGSVQFFTMV